ncbi:hypothetical protein Aduo_005622 [Ancylostoma duodenale]
MRTETTRVKKNDYGSGYRYDTSAAACDESEGTVKPVPTEDGGKPKLVWHEVTKPWFIEALDRTAVPVHLN